MRKRTNVPLFISLAVVVLSAFFAGSLSVTAQGAGSDFHTLSPIRVLDTRAALRVGPCDTVQPLGTCVFDVPAAVPASATAVVLNLTAASITATGHAVVWAAGQPLPATSNLNFNEHNYADSNEAIVSVTSSRQLAIFSGAESTNSHGDHAGTTDFIVDVVGYFEAH